MINYTEHLTLLMRDVVARVPTLSFIDMADVLVFGRFGRADALRPRARLKSSASMGVDKAAAIERVLSSFSAPAALAVPGPRERQERDRHRRRARR